MSPNASRFPLEESAYLLIFYQLKVLNKGMNLAFMRFQNNGSSILKKWSLPTGLVLWFRCKWKSCLQFRWNHQRVELPWFPFNRLWNGEEWLVNKKTVDKLNQRRYIMEDKRSEVPYILNLYYTELGDCFPTEVQLLFSCPSKLGHEAAATLWRD